MRRYTDSGPAILTDVRSDIIASGERLTQEDCVYIVESALLMLPDEALGAEPRIVGAIKKSVRQSLGGVYADVDRARVLREEIRARRRAV